MYVLDNDTTEPDDDGQSRSGVFRRIMARDLYELTKRVRVLEQDPGNPFQDSNALRHPRLSPDFPSHLHDDLRVE